MHDNSQTKQMLDTTLDLSTYDSMTSSPLPKKSPTTKKPLSLQQLLDEFEKDTTFEQASKPSIDFFQAEPPKTCQAKTSKGFEMKVRLSSIITKNTPKQIQSEKDQGLADDVVLQKPKRKGSSAAFLGETKAEGRSNSHIWNKYGEQGEVSIQIQTPVPNADDKGFLTTRRPTKSHTTGTCTGTDRKVQLPVIMNLDKVGLTSSHINLGQTSRGERFDINTEKVFASQVPIQIVRSPVTFREKFFTVVPRKDLVISPRSNLQPMSSRGPIQATSVFKLKSFEEKVIPTRTFEPDNKKTFEAKGLRIDLKPGREVVFRKRSHQPLGCMEKVMERL